MCPRGLPEWGPRGLVIRDPTLATRESEDSALEPLDGDVPKGSGRDTLSLSRCSGVLTD